MAETKEPWSEGMILEALMLTRKRVGFCLPRYTPARWFECDLFELTKAGYFREYEIKISRADFRADVLKQTEDRERFDRQARVWNTEPGVRKHALLDARDTRGPTRFWYVCPRGLIDPKDLPPWAGLIEFYRTHMGSIREQEVRASPILHREKPDPKVIEHARGVCYWRYHEQMARVNRLMRMAQRKVVERG